MVLVLLTKQVSVMDLSDILFLFLALVILVLYLRLMRKNRRLRQLADIANSSRRTAAEAEARNRQIKQEMTSNIAHELKTPLASLQGYLEILLSDKPITDEQRIHFLQRSYQQVMRLSHLVHDVSLINKAEESADLFPREDLDVRCVAQLAIEDLADKAAEAHITVHNFLPPLPLTGNQELLYALFRNLIDNSIHYAGTGIEIVIESYSPSPSSTHNQQSNTYFLHFYDTGCGVADEFLSRIFDRFLRIDHGRSRQSGGTGLGLSIVKHAVLFHGGEIYAKNRPQGGLEFFFSLSN